MTSIPPTSLGLEQSPFDQRLHRRLRIRCVAQLGQKNGLTVDHGDHAIDQFRTAQETRKSDRERQHVDHFGASAASVSRALHPASAPGTLRIFDALRKRAMSSTEARPHACAGWPAGRGLRWIAPALEAARA